MMVLFPELKHLKLDLTSQCNQSCFFCPYHGCNPVKQVTSHTQLSKEIIMDNIFREGNNFYSVQISGSGEGMLHPDFQEISEFIRAKVENFRIITNGALLRRYQECVARNFDSVLVSLHGNEQTHDSITRTVGAHKRAISGILALQDIGYNGTRIHYVLTFQNMKDVPYIIEFAHKYNVPIVFALDFLPDITQYPQYMDAMKECMQRIREGGFIVNPNLNNKELSLFFTAENYVIDPKKCNHRNDTIEIVSNGDVYVCRSEVFGNVYHEELNGVAGNAKRIHFLDQVTRELQTEQGLTDPRCNRCCYQKSPKQNQPE